MEMQQYVSQPNLLIIASACNKMLQEKFNITLPENKLQSIVKDFSVEIQSEYGNMDLQTKELNHITLSKIKNYFEAKQAQRGKREHQPTPTIQPAVNINQQPQSQQSITAPPDTIPTTPIKEELLNDDVIKSKLRNLEMQKRMIEQSIIQPAQTISQQSQLTQPLQQQPLQHQPIHVNIPPPVVQHKYKSLIINSINRDWSRTPARNGIRFALPIDPYSYKYYIDCVCLPTFVKQITPYVLIGISDGHKNVLFALTLATSSVGWDVWRPVDDAENIAIDNKNWIIKFYDQMNSEINLGSDGVNVLEAKYIDDKHFYTIKLDKLEAFEDNFKPNDTVLIRAYNSKVYRKQIAEYRIPENTLSFADTNGELTIDDFINSKILNVSNQYSIIIKYYYDK
jgi:hypothetical protein